MKTFNSLKSGDKFYIDDIAVFVHHIYDHNGYLAIVISYDREDANSNKICYRHRLFIPSNHLKANNLKIGFRWIFLTEKPYKKYMQKHINEQLNK